MAPTERSALQRRIALLGYPCVGKSSITQRFVNGTFPDAYDTTIEDFHLTKYTFMGKKYDLKITDTAGQQEYSLFPRSCVIDVDGYILAYAINDRKSFEILQTIYDKILDHVGDTVPIMVVGNKLDLQHTGRMVRLDEGQRLAENWKAGFLETSAKDNMDVQKIFEHLLRQIEISKGNLKPSSKGMMPESRNIFVPGAQPNNSPPSPRTNTDVRIPVDETSDAASEIPASHSDNTAIAAKTLANAADLAQAKIESLKKWTVSTYKTTRHSINEQLGKATRTVDADLDQRIDALRELHCRYQSLLKLATAYTGYFSLANNTQRDLAEAFYQLSDKEDGLKNELCVHSEALRGVCQNGDILFRALSYFTSAMQTLSDKTIQDTLLTVDRHDQARLEYDVYRYELENLRSQPNPMASLDEAEQKAAAAKSKYDQLKEDVRIKLTLLEENRGKVMRRQIALVQKAFGSYFEGNTETLKKTLEQLGDGAELTPIEDDDPMSNHVKHPPSFLENNM